MFTGSKKKVKKVLDRRYKVCYTIGTKKGKVKAMEAKQRLKQEINSAWLMLQDSESRYDDDSKEVCMWRSLWYAYHTAFKIVYGEEYNHD